MKSRSGMWKIATLLIAALAVPLWTAAQDNPSPDNKPKLKKYRLIDLGTLGGPNSQVNGTPPPMINNEGTVAGLADTSSPCLYLGGQVSPAFKWQHGVLINMGLLPGGCFSLPNAINSKGMMVGAGDIGVIDPQTGQPELRADFRYDGPVVNRGRLAELTAWRTVSTAGAWQPRGRKHRSRPLGLWRHYRASLTNSVAWVCVARRSLGRSGNSGRAGFLWIGHQRPGTDNRIFVRQ